MAQANRKIKALGHVKLDVYRLGKRGYSALEESSSHGIDPDFDSEETKSQLDASFSANKPRERVPRNSIL